MAGEDAARRAGERELKKRLEDGEPADSAVYRSWVRYHNTNGGTDPWQAWKRRYMATATRKESAMKAAKKAAKAAARPDAPSVPSIPRRVPLRPVSVAGVGSTAVMSPFEEEVRTAEVSLARAQKSGDSYAITAAKTALREAKYRLVSLKMMAAENARERDPATVARAMRGMGVPLLSNRHALRDDPSLRGI